MMLYEVNTDGRNYQNGENHQELSGSEEVIFEPQQTEVDHRVNCEKNPIIIQTQFNSVLAFVRNKMLLKQFSIYV